MFSCKFNPVNKNMQIIIAVSQHSLFSDSISKKHLNLCDRTLYQMVIKLEHLPVKILTVVNIL